MDKIAILDFGGQTAHLIANRVRRLGVYSEIIRPSIDISRLDDYKGIIFSGGPSSVYDEESPEFNQEILEAHVPILGICYGHQLIAHSLGGKVHRGSTKEYGVANVRIDKREQIFDGMDEEETLWMSHGDKVEELPPGFESMAHSVDCDVVAMMDPARRLYGVQFHPEVTHSKNGIKVIENFIFNVCGCEKGWDISGFEKELEERIKKQVGDRNVFLFVSGGVDSTVLFALLNNALGKERVKGFHIDTGFMRRGESKEVMIELKEKGFDNLELVDARQDYYDALKGVIEPEKKRKIIGTLFIDIKNRVVDELGLKSDEWVLAQGTIYPDTIESMGTENSALIKTHHNRVDAVLELIKEGKVIEPLDQLYKDEVRQLGELLGISKEIVWRHPFPGPGLAIRILCAEEESWPENVHDLDVNIQMVLDEFSFHNGGFEWMVLPIRSVGVKGDSRSYEHPLVISGVFPGWKVLEQISTAITNRIPAINRVLFSLKPDHAKFVDGIEPQLVKGDLSRERVWLLKDVDKFVMNFTKENGLYDSIWQFPVILLPIGLGERGDMRETIVLRPFDSTNVMTVRFSQIDINLLEKMAEGIMKHKVSSVLYDITNKPPGTVEWE